MTDLLLPPPILHPVPTHPAAAGSSPDPTMGSSLPTEQASGLDLLSGDHTGRESQTCSVPADLLPPPIELPDTRDAPAAGPSPTEPKLPPHSKPPAARLDLLSGDHSPLDTHPLAVPADLLPPPSHGPHPIRRPAAGPSPRAEAKLEPSPTGHPLRLEDALLRIYADTLDDLEKTRIATTNRIGALQREGLGDSPERDRLDAIAAGLAALEHSATLDLQRAMRKHPLGPWVKRTAGIGEKQGGRLIATIGNPAWNGLHNRPRTLGELWAYCGYHVIDGAAPARRKGQRANWNADAKMRAYLCAEACMKGLRKPCAVDEDTKRAVHVEACGCFPLRVVYDDTRTHHADAVHAAPCCRCGPAGKPAQPGSPLSPGHQHARALRAVAKEILRGLWLEARTDSAEVTR